MITRIVPATCLLALAAAFAEENPHGKTIPNAPLPAKVDFNRDIRPFFSAKCFHCHGPDEKTREAGLRLDLREEALKERDGVIAIKPGSIQASDVIARITTADEDDVMPPKKDGHPLTPREIELMKKWISEGASYAEHWAFVPPARPRPPIADVKSQISDPIDAFIAAELQKSGLSLSPRADPHTLIRRLSLDITGLPPAPGEVRSFAQSPDVSRESVEKLVDRLLASKAYGERMARLWLDIARYADSAGYGSDPLRLNIWPYRDWVISAFNRNLPYDQFTLEQLAGDLVPNPTEDQLVATAFHRNTMTNTEGGTDDEEFRVAAVKDRAAITIQAWMGLTMNCAQCHSHKFDPISQKEYYQFYAIFNQTEDSGKGDDYPTMPLPTAGQRAQMKLLESEIAALESKLSRPDEKALAAELAAWEPQMMKPVQWTVLPPEDMDGRSQTTLEAQPDGSVFVHGLQAGTDTYTIKTKTSLDGITAIRLEVIPDDRLPNKGPGRSSGGNFVLNEFSLSASELPAKKTTGRIVRIEQPGKQTMVHLAEVQVFSRGVNVALKGTANQSGQYDAAAAKRAIDGKTDGDYHKNSVSHTAITDNAFWEVDLAAETELDKIVIWNRTDGGTATRLKGAKLSVLDGKRNLVFDTTISDPPKTSADFALSSSRTLPLANASAGHSQGGFDVAGAIDGDAKTGWAIGGAIGQPHAAVFEIQKPPKTGKQAELTLTLTHLHGDMHNLGRFRISATTAPHPVRELPSTIRGIIAKEKSRRSADESAKLLAYFTRISKLYAETQKRIEAKKTALAAIKPMSVPILRELPKDKLRVTKFLNKGNFLDPGETVQPGLLTAFHAMPLSVTQASSLSSPAGDPPALPAGRRPADTDRPEARPTRVTVAKYLTSRDNPLTARVMVNRIWAMLFGTGLVETEEDFGTQGTLPSHPELLDWLAVHFMDDLKWDIKALIKTIVMSDTYQQSSKTTAEHLQKDPRCRLLSRYPRRRLDAETVRDQALALSGLLSPKIGGPSVYPPQPDGLWRAAFNGQRSWETSKGEDRYRRALYTFWRRTVPYPSMATFDAPSRENPTFRRSPTNTPLHAFVTMNDPAFVEMAQALARRIMREGGSTAEARARFALETVLARPASPEQQASLVQLYKTELANYQSKPEDARRFATQPLGPLPAEMNPADAAAWTTVANVLLNLDGVLTKG